MSDGTQRPRAEAVFWDLDGTVVDTEPYWIEAQYELVQAHGVEWGEEHADNLVGLDLLDAGQYIREYGGVDLEPVKIVDKLVDRVFERTEEHIPWRPGAVELLANLRSHGIRCGLVTGSFQRSVAPVLSALPRDTFDVVVTGDAGGPGKPDPEPYLRAARALGVDPRRTLAIEDSNTGACAAETAGCTVLVVPNHVSVDPGMRRILYSSLEGLTFGTLPTPVPF